MFAEAGLLLLEVLFGLTSVAAFITGLIMAGGGLKLLVWDNYYLEHGRYEFVPGFLWLLAGSGLLYGTALLAVFVKSMG